MTLPDRPHSYREFINPEDSMYLSNKELLTKIADIPNSNPHTLADHRYRENVIRLQLRDLADIGLIRPVAHGTYQLTDFGRNVHCGTERLPAENGLFDLEAVTDYSFPDSDWRLTDFSNLDGETIKKLNFDAIEAPQEEYGLIRGSRDTTRRRIGNVAETDLHRLMREFPTHEPLPQQCAHWLRAMVGVHFFPDANHRTAMGTLSVLYQTLRGEPLPVGDDIERVVLESKIARHFFEEVRFDTLWMRDPLYYVWHRYFRRILCDGGSQRHDPPRRHLQMVLNYAREIR